MKKALFLALVWYLNVNSGEKTEWYIELYTNGNVTVSVPRDEFLEYKLLLNTEYTPKPIIKKAYLNAKINEYYAWEINK